MRMKNLVAVYGSLLSGLGNHRVMERARGELLGTGESVINIDMYSLGGFPSISLAHSEHKSTIRVEVYEVDDEGMKPLNMLEGYRGEGERNFYNRSLVDIKLDNGDVVEAFIYHIDEQQSTPVVDGDWREYLTKRGRA
ncbi:hypothetical protein TacPo2_16 [Pantoea bacteriophage TacPo2]